MNIVNMKALDKIRLDKFLISVFPDKTRAFLQKMIKGGSVLVNGEVVRKNGVELKPGDDVAVEFPSVREIGVKPEKIDLDVLFEDDDIIVVNKPAGMVVHPSESGGNTCGTLVNAVLYRCKGGLTGISGDLRPGIVHRLDKNTSGTIIVAKTDKAHQSLVKQFAGRTVSKKYVALVRGAVSPSHAIIDSPIGRSFKDRKKMTISSLNSGRNAITEYKVLKEYGDHFGKYSLLDIELKTGRTHQIRVHMVATGHPVIGDITYGDRKINDHFLKEYGLDRQFLHAKTLEITHPSTGKRVKFESDISPKLKSVLNSLEAGLEC